MTEYGYEYYSVSKKWLNTNTNIIQQKEGLLDLFWGSKGDAKFAESSDDQS